MRVITANGRDRNSMELQKEFNIQFAIDESRIPRAKLLLDPAICPRVKSLLRRMSGVEQRTPEWFRQRSEKLTGSAIASAIGLCPYRSRDKLMKEKLGLVPRFSGNAASLRGQQLEHHALVAYQKKTGNRAIEIDLGLLDHEEHDEIAASPDGVTTNGILLEIKCPLRRRIVQGVIPKHYIPQLQTLMEIMNLDRAHFIDFKPKSIVAPEICAVTELKRDRRWFAKYFPIMRAFVHEMRRKRKNGFVASEKKKKKVVYLDLGLKDDSKDEFGFIGEAEREPESTRVKKNFLPAIEPEEFGFF